VDVIPNFPGDFSKFVRRNLDQTKSSQSGRINVTFIIEKDGSLSDVKAVGRIFDQNAANEAVRIMKLSPKWNPGIQNGNLVRVQYTVPVVFD
jgi:outer membrane biosynthesis protein TonB